MGNIRSIHKEMLAIVRGAFANPFELQNYYPLQKKYDLRLITSLNPLSTDIDLPTTKLWSPTDLPNFPFKFPILNRLMTDIHYLHGLEKAIAGSSIVHAAETYYHYTYQAALMKKNRKIKRLVSTVWEVIPHNNEGIKGRDKFKQLVYEQTDLFVCPTNLAKKALMIEGVGEEKIKVIPVGVDLDRFHPVKKTDSNFNILCVARLVPEKGIGELVDGFNALKIKNKKLTIVGSGPLANKINNKNIEIKNVPYDQIHLEYQKADIFCLMSKNTPTWQEQYGMALVEALASGLPIVTTKAGAIPEVVGEACLYADGDFLASVFENLAHGDSLRRILANKARQRAENCYDHIKIAKRLDIAYQSLLK